MENSKLNFGIKTRTKIVLCELAMRLLNIIYCIIMLFIQLLCLLPMMFSQKHYDAWVEMIRANLTDDDNE